MTTHQRTTRYVAGIDLHKRPLVMTIMDHDGTVVYQSRTHRRKQAWLAKVLAPYGTDITVCVESTYNWYWVRDWCAAGGIPFALGHAYYLSKLSASKQKDDDRDAYSIAHRMRLSDVPVAYALPKEIVAVRDLCRRRLKYVRMRAGVQNHIECVHDQYLLEERHEELLNGPERAIYQPVWDSLDADQEVSTYLEHLTQKLERTIARHTRHLQNRAWELLMRIRGVGAVIAMTLLLEIGEVKRFKSVQAFSSYARVVNARHESGGKCAGRGNNRNGNPYLCYALHELVETSRRYVPEIAAVFNALKRKRGVRHAHRVLAHRWAEVIYFMLKHETEFSLEKFVHPYRGCVSTAGPSNRLDAQTVREPEEMIGSQRASA